MARVSIALLFGFVLLVSLVKYCIYRKASINAIASAPNSAMSVFCSECHQQSHSVFVSRNEPHLH